jgi:enoyl-[acyl-carrier-protein] reductase (NADH)
VQNLGGKAIAVRADVSMRDDVKHVVTEAGKANTVTFLASDASAYITGESTEINGGLYFV